MSRVIAAMVLIFCSAAAWAQCAHYAKNPVFSQSGQIIPFPSARVCQEVASGTTCLPLVPGGIFSDRACSQALPNPMTGDGQGNIDFYTPATRVHLQINGAGISQIDVSDVPVADPLQPVLTPCTVAFTSTPAFDPSACTIFQMTLTGNVTSSTIVNQISTSAGRSLIFKICQDGVGGHSFAWPSGFQNTPTIAGIGASNCVNAPYWFDGTNWNPTGASSFLSSITLAAVGPGATGSGTYDFSAATVVKMPVAAGFSTSSNGSLGYDTTNKNWHFFGNGVDNLNAMVPASVTETNNDCVKWTVSGGTVTLNDNGGPCAATIASVSHNFLTSYTSTTGAFTQAQPACGDLSNASPSCSTDATIASNITSGTLPAARLPNPSASTLGGIQSLAAVSHLWINTISTSGVPSATRPACGDLSDSVASCNTDATNASNISAGTLAAARMNPTVGSHFYLGNQTGGSAAAAFQQPVAGDITPGANGQCIITTGSISTWGSCAGTAGVQTLFSFAGTNVVNTATTSVQTMTSTSISGGTFNSLNKQFRVVATGSMSFVASTTIDLQIQIGSLVVSDSRTISSTVNSGAWKMTALCGVDVTGSSGDLRCTGEVTYMFTTAPLGGLTVQTASGTTNLTTSLSIQANAAFSTSNASNTATNLTMTVEMLN